ncbi:hypothetical protein EF888_06445 [Silicimonas algicola]|uniref:DUF6647 domain-containing protein n=1 Tax=Silicimonas algicola TaxID=1826607 RepID=A0A316G2V7_9RHOB|nr:DUF6647 family protein [Silicimonas algicola]AZQ66811.1 hypothetical protein EF888_06445 [Silicimonas algicola]PWK55284.1 hypothetical protein C8D95_108164 [Silicimonas algicola]
MVSLASRTAILMSLSFSVAPPLIAEPYAAECPADNLRQHGPGPDLADLWDWVRGELSFEDDLPPPQVCRVDSDVIQAMRPGTALDTVALYDRARHRILLSRYWNPADAVDQSVIVHELVHHAQALSGRRLACASAGEAEAYDLQAKWLDAHDLDLDTAFGIDALTRLVLVNCAY